jgi:hypothetical protein
VAGRVSVRSQLTGRNLANKAGAARRCGPGLGSRRPGNWDMSRLKTDGRDQCPSMDWAVAACPRDVPELPSRANDRRHQHSLNLKARRAWNPRATHGNTLVMRRSPARGQSLDRHQVVSDPGSELGAASRPHMRPGAVRVAALSAPASNYSHCQAHYSNVYVVRDEEAAGSNPATPTQLTGHLRSSRVAFSRH